MPVIEFSKNPAVAIISVTGRHKTSREMEANFAHMFLAEKPIEVTLAAMAIFSSVSIVTETVPTCQPSGVEIALEDHQLDFIVSKYRRRQPLLNIGTASSGSISNCSILPERQSFRWPIPLG